VLGGDAVVAPSATRRLLDHVAGALPAATGEDPRLEQLTPREREVLLVTLQASSDRTPPSTPVNLTATQPPDDFCGSNVLSWDASTDDTDAQPAIEYEIYRDGSLFTVGQPGVASAFLYTPAGTSTWTVVAVDRSGNSSGASNAATLTVRADESLC